MEGVPREGFLQKASKVTEQLQNLQSECKSVINQLNQQVVALSEIGEDTTVVTEKITLLQDHFQTIEKGLEESEVRAFIQICNNLNFHIMAFPRFSKNIRKGKLLH